MFDIGDYIVYGINGICRVADITHPDISGADGDRLYYVLIPEKARSSKLFCPADNDRIMIRKVISCEEAKQIIAESKTIEPLCITNERMRDDSYKSVMKSGDCRQWIQIIKTLLIRKKEREENGKKITATDERYLKMAEEGLYSELALATGSDKEKIRDIIIQSVSE
ncbi:MAG: CarD family transcriptional regulator [Lachnospiraceae bacterium]|nr:CarD family transcriptional regulator [Lachnospiraceae bacterium]